MWLKIRDEAPFDIPCCVPLKANYTKYPWPTFLLCGFLSQVYSWTAVVALSLKALFSPLINSRRSTRVAHQLDRREASGEPCYLTLCATRGYLHGHAFLIWGKGANRHETEVRFKPRRRYSGYWSVFHRVAGMVTYDDATAPGDEVLYSLEVTVDKACFERVRNMTREWETTFYICAKRDCLTHLYKVAEEIGLKNPKRGAFYLYTIPETYLPELLRLNTARVGTATPALSGNTAGLGAARRAI